MTWEKWFEKSGFRLVYMGGHHNVYCDGSTHIRTTGGTAGWTIAPNYRWSPFECDCPNWNKAK